MLFIQIHTFCSSLFSTAECSMLTQSSICLGLDKEQLNFISILRVSRSCDLQSRITMTLDLEWCRQVIKALWWNQKFTKQLRGNKAGHRWLAIT